MSRNEIEALADRLLARANSKFTVETDQWRYQRSDLRKAAELLREYSAEQSTKKISETDAGFMPIRTV